MVERGFSQDPTERLIRELIRTRGEATPAEIERIVNRMATAPLGLGLPRLHGLFTFKPQHLLSF